MLEVSNLSRSYGSFRAVDDVTFTIEQGEIVGLLGHNGAGKTTIMKMLSGYLEPDQGQVVVDGLTLEQDSGAVQAVLGYLPESLPVYSDMIVADYLDYVASLKGLRGHEKANELRRVIQETDIADKLLEPISTLSRGYKQRVGVAQAVLGKPKLLILDEPTNGLDPTQTEQMRALIRDIAKSATVVLSTHIMQEVEALCDRVLILRQGRLVVDARLEELRDSHRLLVDCSLDEAEKLEIASHVKGVSAAQTLENGLMRVKLQENASARDVAADLARKLHEQGADIFGLRHEHRDLETLFREVNQTPEAEVSRA